MAEQASSGDQVGNDWIIHPPPPDPWQYPKQIAVVPAYDWVASAPDGSAIPSPAWSSLITSIQEDHANHHETVGAIVLDAQVDSRQFFPVYATEIQQASNAFTNVFGYVKTGQGSRPAADVIGDVDFWVGQYVHGRFVGFFYDEGPWSGSGSQRPGNPIPGNPDPTMQELYLYYYNYGKGALLPEFGDEAIVWLNAAGTTQPNDQWVWDASDIVTLYEGGVAGYDPNVACPVWASDRKRVAHVIVDAQASQLQSLVQKSCQLGPNRSPGWLYLTDEGGGGSTSQYGTLPTYWAQERQAIGIPFYLVL